MARPIPPDEAATTEGDSSPNPNPPGGQRLLRFCILRPMNEGHLFQTELARFPIHHLRHRVQTDFAPWPGGEWIR